MIPRLLAQSLEETVGLFFAAVVVAVDRVASGVGDRHRLVSGAFEHPQGHDGHQAGEIAAEVGLDAKVFDVGFGAAVDLGEVLLGNHLAAPG